MAALDAALFTARVRAAYGPDGRLALPDMTDWDIFPFEGDLLVKPLADPVLPEPPRKGEDAADCDCRRRRDDSYLWTDEHWRLGTLGEPAGVPAFLLHPRAHADLGELSDDLAAELGVLTVRLDRILSAIPGVGRVHVNKWGDGGAHLHVWFLARPAGGTDCPQPAVRVCCPAADRAWLDFVAPRVEGAAGARPAERRAGVRRATHLVRRGDHGDCPDHGG